MDLRNTDDSNVCVPNEMNKTQLPTFTTIYWHFLYLLTILKSLKLMLLSRIDNMRL